MSYEGTPQEVPLEGADRDQARNHLDSAIKELGELSRLVARTMGRADESADRDPAFTRVVIDYDAASSDAVDVGVSTFCSGTECLYVYDAFEGICRPCGPDDHACDPVSHLAEQGPAVE